MKKESNALYFLTKFLLMKEQELQDFILAMLPSYGYAPVVKGEGDEKYIYAIGQQPYLMVGHTDTVLPTPGKLKVTTNYNSNLNLDINNMVFSGDISLGADDRAGVAAIFYFLDLGYRPSLFFPSGEEKGGLGTKAFIKEDLSVFADKINFMLEFDRQGRTDVVQYHDTNTSLLNLFTTPGFFVKAEGSFTDISLLMPAFGVSGLNFSIGYYSQHTEHEYISYNAFLKSLQAISTVLDSFDFNIKHVYVARTIVTTTFNYDPEYKWENSYRYSDYSSPSKPSKPYVEECDLCAGVADPAIYLQDGMVVCQTCCNEPSNNLANSIYGFCPTCNEHQVLELHSIFGSVSISFNTIEKSAFLSCPECKEPLSDVNLDVLVDSSTTLRDFLSAKLKGFKL